MSIVLDMMEYPDSATAQAVYVSSDLNTTYGDGSDGDVTISANTNLTANKQYNNLTINAGITLNTAGHTVKVLYTLLNNGTITDSSTGGAGGSGGAGGAGYVGDGNGAAGSGGGAGTGTGGTGGGGGGGGAGQNAGVYSTTGGNGGSAGAGGKGGGTVTILAKTFTNNGAIHVNGFAGLAGGGGGIGNYLEWQEEDELTLELIDYDIASGGGGGGAGGNGGNGGTVSLTYQDRTIGTVTVNGGSAGSAGAGGAGQNCWYTLPGGIEYSGGAGGSPGGGAGGKGEEGADASGPGIGGAAGSVGLAGSATWTQISGDDNLQSYSESTIKTQGSYSLKGVAAITNSLNDTLTRTIAAGSEIDLTGVNKLEFGIRASRTGSNIKIGLQDSGGIITEIIPDITVADTWQTVGWQFAAILDANKDAINSIIITIVDAALDNTFYLDNFYGITFTPKVMMF